MASALSNHALSFSSRPQSSISHSKRYINSPKTLSLTVPLNPRPRSLSSSRLSRRTSGASLRVAGTDPKTVNGDDKNQVLVDQTENTVEQDVPSMKVLVQAFKKAMLDGDEKRAYEIEGAISIMENEKTSLSLKLGELSAEIASEKDRFLRLKANFENHRKRIEKDRLNLTSDVQGEVIESLLPLVDSFERAKQHLEPETETEKMIDTSYQGIYKQFVEIMRSLHVAVVGTVGKPFDPSVHEAVAREESQNFKEGIVMQEVRRGFVLGDRLLRPATVKVSIGPGPRKVTVTGAANEDTAATSSGS